MNEWISHDHPGFFGKNREERFQNWDSQYGQKNWRIRHKLSDGTIWDFDQMFWFGFVAGYTHYFFHHENEAQMLAQKYVYTFDKVPLTSKRHAFDPYAQYEKPGMPNQFHHVALNIAVERFLGHTFCGEQPLQVREGYAGEQWGPGRIQFHRPELIGKPQYIREPWCHEGSVEDVYQNTKVLQLRK